MAEVGAVKIGATRPSGVGAFSDQTRNALDELVNKAKDRIAD